MVGLKQKSRRESIRRRRRSGTLALFAVADLIAAFGLVPWHRAIAATAGSVLPEAGMPNPRLRFSADSDPNAPHHPSQPAELPGRVSRWTIYQWKKQELLGPDTRRPPQPRDADPRLGRPTDVFETRSQESRLAIFAGAHPPVYELESEGGRHDADGGANLFLAARTGRRLATFDRPITYGVTLRLSHALASAPRSRSLRDGSVLAQVLSGFVLEFRRGPARPTTLFLQIAHADSRGRQPDYRSCKLHRDGSAVAVYTGVLPEDDDLRFEAGLSPVRFHYGLNRYLCHALQASFPCDHGNWMPPAEARNLASWRMREMYVGLETQNTRSVGQDREMPTGTVDAAIQISGVAVTRDRSGATSDKDVGAKECRQSESR